MNKPSRFSRPNTAKLGSEKSPLKIQHGGTHYKDMRIQPIEYIFANQLGYCEGNVIKYITRWKTKGGVEDLNKAKHYIELLLEEVNGLDKCKEVAP